jgi:hypothetical protein
LCGGGGRPSKSPGDGGDVAGCAAFGINIAGDLGRNSKIATLHLDVLKMLNLTQEQI